MEFHFVVLLFLTSLTLAITTAMLLPQEVYWQSVFPTTPMPNALTDLLPSEDTSKQANGMSFKDNAIVIDIGGIDIEVGDGVSVDIPAILGSLNPFSYKYGPSKYELKQNRNTTLFFLGKDLQPGKHMNLNLVRISIKGKILSRRVADTIPFSSSKFSEIQNKFSIKPNSTVSKIMKKTIEECEEPEFEGEEKYCATSLEGMVDFIASKLGKKNIRALSTEIDKDRVEQQKFIIEQGVRSVGANMVVCHPQIYAYSVFYCHKMHQAKAYAVSLLGTDGTKVKAIVVCHADTSKWNPKHLAFQVLKVKPGTVPICHFLPANHILFVVD